MIDPAGLRKPALPPATKYSHEQIIFLKVAGYRPKYRTGAPKNSKAMNIDNTASQMRKGVLEFCILSVIKQGEAYPSDIIDKMRAANLNIFEGTLYPLLTRLKNACGAGGAIEDDGLEIQGDQLDRLRKLLAEFGYKVRG